jgi:hypothetical protein
MLLVLPFVESSALYGSWDFTRSVAGNAAAAQTDVSTYYCPSRRDGLRERDRPFALDPSWTGGGNDYGGCLGSGNGFKNTGHHRFGKDAARLWNADRHIGIFSPNSKTRFRDIQDGTSKTLAIAELQRLQDPEIDQRRSYDGWAVGGQPTLFTTAMDENGFYQTGGINNGFFEAAGSEHPGGANVGLADASVQFLSENTRTDVIFYLGSMHDGQVVQLP